jgi:hypothetical protein
VQWNSSFRETTPAAARATSSSGGVWYPLGNRPLPQVVMRSLDQVSWLPRFLLTRLPMGSPQWHCERSYSVQLREQRPNGTSLFQRGCVQKQTSRHPYTKDQMTCQDPLPKSIEGVVRISVCLSTSRSMVIHRVSRSLPGFCPERSQGGPFIVPEAGCVGYTQSACQRRLDSRSDITIRSPQQFSTDRKPGCIAASICDQGRWCNSIAAPQL